jgi:hypothetical protein
MTSNVGAYAGLSSLDENNETSVDPRKIRHHVIVCLCGIRNAAKSHFEIASVRVPTLIPLLRPVNPLYVNQNLLRWSLPPFSL